MAKMIKCPTCSTQIEVPPAQPGQGAAGQIIKCPGCGKQLKIVVKRPPTQQTGQTPGGVPSPGGSLAGSLAGASVSSMTYQGEPPPSDDPPSLDSNCAVCGKAVDPDDLVEDNGRLICRDCVKGARSKIDRPSVAPDLLDFKKPAANVRRSRLINITPSFIAAVIAAAVLIACQVYLTLVEEPHGKGRAMASMVTPPAPIKPTPPVDSATTQPSNEQSTGAQASATTQPAAPGTVAVTPNATTELTPPLTPSPSTTEPASPAVVAATTTPAGSALFPEPTATQAVAAPPPADAPNTSIALANGTGPAIPPAIVNSANDPLLQGIAKLQNHDYAAARNLLQAARAKYVAGKLTDHLNAEQQMALVGLAAACIGQGKFIDARSPLDLVIGSGTTTPARGTKTRSAVLDNAIVLIKHASSPRDIYEGLVMMREYLGSAKGDEYAADIFGTLLDHASTMSGLKPDDVEKLQQFTSTLDGYVDDLAHDQHPDQSKWGIEWKDKTIVQQYRAARGRPANAAAPIDMQKQLEAAEAKVASLQQALTTAKATHGDVIGAQNQLNAAYADEGRIQTQMKQVAGPAPKPKWLDKFEPVLPEGTVTTQ